MAEALNDETGGKTGRKAKKAAKAKAPKANGKAPGPGHNSADAAANLTKFLSEMDVLKDDQEKVNGEFMVDISQKKEKYANLTGYSRKFLSKVYNRHRRELKEELARQDMEAKDREQFDEVMALCSALPLFGAAAAEKRTKN